MKTWLLPLLPEISLLFIALFLQIIILFSNISRNVIAIISSALIIFLLALIALKHECLNAWVFNHTYVVDSSIILLKVILLLFLLLSNFLFIGGEKVLDTKISYEYFPLSILCCLGGFIMISARDFLTLFMGIELQSLASYILASYYKNNPQSSEAGLKYLTLGACSSAVMLLGISFIYGVGEMIDYTHLSFLHSSNLILGFGFCIILISLFFKLGASPVHMWVMDVYQGSPIFSLNIFISINKLSALVALINFLKVMNISFEFSAAVIIKVCVVFSLGVGALGALTQVNFKRLIGYSSIFNIGYVTLAVLSQEYNIAILYLILYTVNVFVLLYLVLNSGLYIENLKIQDLAKIGDNKTIILMIICIFSLIGMPPLGGFIIKYAVLYAAVEDQQFYILIFTIISTVISAFYYLRLIRFMLFNDEAKKILLHKPSAIIKCINYIGISILVFASLFFNFLTIGLTIGNYSF